MRLIDADALIEDFKKRTMPCEEWIKNAKDKDLEIRAEATRDFIYEVVLTISKAPTIEPDRPHGEWIPVSERLPEENETVIASTEYGVFPEATYTKEDGWAWAYESGADYWEELEGVIAWMPLPEPYKKEGDEK